jgi:uncharacterized membrane protein
MRWETSIVIAAPVARVWALTLDITGWPSITPTMTRVVLLDDGPLRVGSRARIKQPRQTEAVWTVSRIDENREFAWQTRRMGQTWTATHVLTPEGNGTRNTLTFDISGPGAGLTGGLIGRVVRSGIETENASFKRAAESPVTPS